MVLSSEDQARTPIQLIPVGSNPIMRKPYKPKLLVRFDKRLEPFITKPSRVGVVKHESHAMLRKQGRLDVR